MSPTPYIGFSNKTLEEAKPLGEYWKCPVCGAVEKIQDSEPKGLQFVRHNGKSYLVGVCGKDVSTVPSDCHGEVG